MMEKFRILSISIFYQTWAGFPGCNSKYHTFHAQITEVKQISKSDQFFDASVYDTARVIWKNLNCLLSVQFRSQYKNGFHVYFQPINGTENDILFRTAEYLVSGYFHNS